jgi:hypothetical protein
MKDIEVSISNDRKLVISINDNNVIHIHSCDYIDWAHIEEEFRWVDDKRTNANIDSSDWKAFVEAVNKIDKLLVLK